MPETDPSPQIRLYFLDALRGLLAILVVLHHVALLYGGIAPFYYTEVFPDHPDFVRNQVVFILVNQAWFMGAFFLLAGYFTPASLERKGPVLFLKDRLLRLGIPLLVFAFVLNPLSSLGVYAMPTSMTGISGPPSWSDYPGMIGMGPMWFVVMLFAFSLLYLGFRKSFDRRIDQLTRTAPPRCRMIFVFILILAAASFLCRRYFPLGKAFWGFPTLAYLPQYLSFFVFGLLAAKRKWLFNIPAKTGTITLLVGLTAWFLLFPLAFRGHFFSLKLTPFLNNAMGYGQWQSAVYALWDSTFAFGICLGLLTISRNQLYRPNRLVTFLSNQSYAVYVIHIPLVVLAGVLLKDLAIHPRFKFLLVSLLVIPGCFSFAYVLRKIPGVSKVL